MSLSKKLLALALPLALTPAAWSAPVEGTREQCTYLANALDKALKHPDPVARREMLAQLVYVFKDIECPSEYGVQELLERVSFVIPVGGGGSTVIVVPIIPSHGTTVEIPPELLASLPGGGYTIF